MDCRFAEESWLFAKSASVRLVQRERVPHAGIVLPGAMAHRAEKGPTATVERAATGHPGEIVPLGAVLRGTAAVPRAIVVTVRAFQTEVDGPEDDRIISPDRRMD